MTDTTTETLCCGEHQPGVAGEPLKLACQLCPDSPTYWRLAHRFDEDRPCPACGAVQCKIARCPRCGDPIEDHVDHTSGCIIWARDAAGDVLTVD